MWTDLLEKTGNKIYFGYYDNEIIKGKLSGIDLENYVNSLKAPMNNFIGQIQPELDKWLGKKKERVK